MVWSDHCKELRQLLAFRNIVSEERFIFELTGVNVSSQNYIAESPNKYLGNVMRCPLHVANLRPEYWSFALLHAAYIKHRISQIFIKKTLFEVITGTQLDLSNFKTFGCRIYSRKPGKYRLSLTTIYQMIYFYDTLPAWRI